MKHKYGLNRNIPSEVKRGVRKNSYFGCVICGNGICQIDHVEPVFEHAREHNPKGMTLLCGTCHDKKTRGIIGLKTVKEAMLQPFCKQKLPSDFFDFGSVIPIIQFGNSTFINPISLISIDGISIFSILPPAFSESKRFY